MDFLFGDPGAFCVYRGKCDFTDIPIRMKFQLIDFFENCGEIPPASS